MRSSRTASVPLAWIPILLAFAFALPSAAEELFEVASFPNRGRCVAAELAELNGDGRADLFVVVLLGIPPEERRIIRVYLQRPDGSLPESPDHTLRVPEWSAVYDIADLVEESPGAELVLLQPEGITLLSLADASGKSWQLPVPGPTTVGLADDERGLEPYTLVYDDFGDEPWILVPQIGRLTALSPKGEVRARLDVPRRANYLILPRTGLVAIESDFQIFVDVPKLAIGDVDGDGRIDIVSSTRHEIRVFLRRKDGSYPQAPDRTLPLRLVAPRDHIRGSGGVASEIADINGDGRLDLLISQVKGGFTDAATTIFLYLNHGGEWKLGDPDQTLTSNASIGSNALFDMDRDGRRELFSIEFQFSMLEVIELLMSREIDIDVAIYRYNEKEHFGKRPWMKKKLSLPVNFDTLRLRGFVPVGNVDVNSDGFLDFVSSGGGKALEIHLGDAKGPLSQWGGRQKMSTAGVIHFADFDGDPLPDFVLHDPHHFDAPVQVGRNLGALPGTPPSLLARPPKAGP
ncbi:MAG: VCBS repeat-containing protein [Deltaproteobacteria bacterium]|nr:VCBS repeat-containing protein [Deltaproteobacteria bacterium]MBW2420314.1 VCBS repeat-containing protein [Deltaproteobacteria bacterium]